jgi:hypothetical protein
LDSRVKTLTKQLKEHDKDLYAKRMLDGVVLVCRKSRNVFTGQTNDQLIFPLTDDFTSKGKPVEWGVEPILAHLKAMDGWNRDVVEDWISSDEKSKEVAAKQRMSKNEDFARDFRRQFARTFDDVNTSTLEKIDNRRRLK